MVKYMSGIGQKGKDMVKENIITQMAQDLKVSGLKIKNKAKVKGRDDIFFP